jgi:flagellar basal-body rod protein FlgB
VPPMTIAAADGSNRVAGFIDWLLGLSLRTATRSAIQPADKDCRIPANNCRFAGSPRTQFGHSGIWHAACSVNPVTQMEFAMPGSLFGIHGVALELRSQRMGLLASNIANAATPGYKARDIDFAAALKANQAGLGAAKAGEAATQYRVPTMASLDGNTVELASEQLAFGENAVGYSATLSFIRGRVENITRALKGE